MTELETLEAKRNEAWSAYLKALSTRDMGKTAKALSDFERANLAWQKARSAPEPMSELDKAKASYRGMLGRQQHLTGKELELKRQQFELAKAQEELDAKIKKQEALILRLIQQEDSE